MAFVTEPQEPNGKQPNPWSYATLGFEVVLPVLLSTYGGYWLDERLGTLPLFLLVGVLLGMAAGFYTLFKRVAGPGHGGSGRKD